jgi:hypothetical protein
LDPNVENCRKRKRIRRAEVINALASDSPAHKRRSSVADLALLSMSGSFLDNTDKNLLTPEPPAERLPAQTNRSDQIIHALEYGRLGWDCFLCPRRFRLILLSGCKVAQC